MAYDSHLLERLRRLAATSYPHLDEKRMFGGIGFFVSGNYAFGASRKLVVRVGPDRYPEALAQPHANVMDVTGRPFTGWVMVDQDGIEDDAQLQSWVQQGVDFAASLPAKKGAPR